MVVNNKLYREEFLSLLGVTDEYKFNTKLDALVIGSDEVFNVFQKSTRVGYSLELFGKIIMPKDYLVMQLHLGTQQYQFDRLIRELDRLVGNNVIKEKVFAQKIIVITFLDILNLKIF